MRQRIQNYLQSNKPTSFIYKSGALCQVMLFGVSVLIGIPWYRSIAFYLTITFVVLFLIKKHDESKK